LLFLNETLIGNLRLNKFPLEKFGLIIKIIKNNSIRMDTFIPIYGAIMVRVWLYKVTYEQLASNDVNKMKGCGILNKAISARIQGDDYQALFFWMFAVKLFQPHTSVEKVIYEADNVKSFDDVVVYYRDDKPFLDCRHKKIYMDCFQVKFHVTQEGSVTWDGLQDPKFINATSYSIMQRLLNAHRKYYVDDRGVRFNLVSPWQIHPDDVLAKLCSNQEGEIRLDKLFDDDKPPGTKLIREQMKKHLDINDDELYRVIESLRIWKDSFTMHSLKAQLNREFLYLGFKPIENSSCLNPYTELIKQWNIRGVNEITKDFIVDECRREGLYNEKEKEKRNYIDIGIRSFYRSAENMQDETEKMLCLLNYYDGRYLRGDVSWQNDIHSEIVSFISKELVGGKKYRLHLDTHLSNAFIAGYYLDTKSGIEVYPTQKTNKGRGFWVPDQDISVIYPDWKVNNVILKEEELDVALVLCITHDITSDVKNYIDEEKLGVSKMVVCQINEYKSNSSVIDGYHAKMLSDSLSRIVKQRSVHEKRKKLHIFAASPAALMFLIGQVARSFGNIALYEYDFDGLRNFGYSLSIELPIQVKES